ncbi:MAG: porin, partial [Candidatus Omnitrophica bacterium]|nr:porin [Candidatus Omnitrophota bacterium]
MRKFWLFIVGIFTVVALGAPSLPAQTEALAVKNKTLDERLVELEQEIRILKRLRELDQETADKKVKETPIVSANEKDGFSIKSPDKQFQLKLKGYAQADARFFKLGSSGLATDQFLLRRVRPYLEGTLSNYVDFRLMPDFGGGTAALQDAYIDLKYSPELKLRAGKFKAPVGLERLQSATDLRFVERAYPTSLAPNRDVGAQLFGDLWNGSVSYAAGIFNGVIDGGSSDGDSNDGKDFAGRIFVKPFKNTDLYNLQELGLGAAGTYGRQSGTVASPNLPSFKSDGQQTFFSYRSTGAVATTTIADGIRTRFSPQATFYSGPFGFLGEYVLSSQQVQRANASTKAENRAWQAAISYVLTGEKASYKGVSPKKPFDLSKNQWGAFELKARYGELQVDEKLFPTFADPAKSY